MRDGIYCLRQSFISGCEAAISNYGIRINRRDKKINLKIETHFVSCGYIIKVYKACNKKRVAY
ncbi:hypothetical protein BpHYR1_013545 [Brachionus plicatilis]|uniref:Uncharacterized protein n=1 Tax=Brachionus plicatilis TaxID=10195 RepID=A0A3M7SDW3_BRAPC|nr:hypothetical protein BpHYR1_013545 [Brachionus plicatilis]